MSLLISPICNYVRHYRYLLLRACISTLIALLGLCHQSIFYLLMPTGSPTHAADTIVNVQMLAINDLHGYLLPAQGPSGHVRWRNRAGEIEDIPAGGVSQLVEALRRARVGHPNSITVGAGDLIGASPLMSGLYEDEPTIDILNDLGLDVSSVGNHEFDSGWRQLVRVHDGGCDTVKGCFPQPNHQRYSGAKFPYLAANVSRKDNHQPIFPAYWVWRKNQMKIGFIGLTLKDTPAVATQAGVENMSFAEEVPTINHYVRVLKSQGINSIVVLVHQGSIVSYGRADNDPCTNPARDLSGPIEQLARHISSDVDVIVTAHSHVSYICKIPDPRGDLRLVTQAGSYGKMFTEFSLPYDMTTGKIIRRNIRATQHYVPANGPHAADIDRQVEFWRRNSANVSNKVVGYISEDITGRGNNSPEKPLGDLIADAQQADMKQYGSQLAFTNRGSLRADFVYSGFPGAAPGTVTFAEVYAVQPFKNRLHLLDFTGEQLLNLLRNQVSGFNEANNQFLQLSSNLRYTVNNKLPGSAKIIVSSIKIDNKPLILSQHYRVTVNEFLSAGGDGYPAFKQARIIGTGDLDSDALIKYLEHSSTPDHPLSAPKIDRITFIS